MFKDPLGRTLRRRLEHAIARRLRAHDWATDLCDYYRVSYADADRLGARAAGRRPDLPGSPTTHPISGRTFEDIWSQRPRATEADIHSFYSEIGAWASFRQCYRHRALDASPFVRDLPPGGSFCEYGAGVAPIAAWLVEHHRRVPYHITIVDVPSEHLTFGAWRVRRRIERLRTPHTLEVIEVQPGVLPLERRYDVIAVLEVFEHLPNPLVIARHVLEHLAQSGVLWENFVAHEHADAADLEVAQSERDAVLALLSERCELVVGSRPEYDPNGTRAWSPRID